MQCVAVRRLIEDLNFDVALRVVNTVREPDGLAMSSRNVYLSEEERAAAPALYSALCLVKAAHQGGERDAAALGRLVRQALAGSPLLQLEYFSLASTVDGRELDAVPDAGPDGGDPPTLASAAAGIGKTRLLDNVLLD